mmetsp:Transcript_13528/g.40563  ORF Transcript_13528/g.40563 Transcript_13528/m.40563 type:complete len:251 (-) Transcript_13528:99-851(-)
MEDGARSETQCGWGVPVRVQHSGAGSAHGRWRVRLPLRVHHDHVLHTVGHHPVGHHVTVNGVDQRYGRQHGDLPAALDGEDGGTANVAVQLCAASDRQHLGHPGVHRSQPVGQRLCDADYRDPVWAVPPAEQQRPTAARCWQVLQRACRPGPGDSRGHNGVSRRGHQPDQPLRQHGQPSRSALRWPDLPQLDPVAVRLVLPGPDGMTPPPARPLPLKGGPDGVRTVISSPTHNDVAMLFGLTHGDRAHGR